MKTHRETVVCVVYDTAIEKQVGRKPAQAFDWIYSFLHINQRGGEVRDGRKWGCFTYQQLVDKSNALPNKDAWRRAIKTLENAELLISENASGQAKWYAINFAKVREMVGETTFAKGYMKDLEPNLKEIPNWNKPYTQSVQNAQGKPQVKGVQNAQATHSKMHREYGQNAQGLLYRINFSQSLNDLTSANADVSDRPADPSPTPRNFEEPPKPTITHDQMWGGWAELTYGQGRTLSRSESGLVGQAVKTARERYGDDWLGEALMSGRFRAWLILTDSWFTDGRITRPTQLQKSLDRMKAFENKKGRDWYEQFATSFPDWLLQADANFSTFVKSARGKFPEMKPKKSTYEREAWELRTTEPEQPADYGDEVRARVEEAYLKLKVVKRNGNNT